MVALTTSAWAKHHKGSAVDPPTLDAVCSNSGATVLTGTDTAGKIVMSVGGTIGTCTLTFTTSDTGRVCVCWDEIEGFGAFGNGPGNPGFLGCAEPTGTTAVIGGPAGWTNGDVIDYLCGG